MASDSMRLVHRYMPTQRLVHWIGVLTFVTLLFSGIALITILGIIFAPVVHRFLHKFHLEDQGRDGK